MKFTQYHFGLGLLMIASINLTGAESYRLEVSLPIYGEYFPAPHENRNFLPPNINARVDEYLVSNFSEKIRSRISFRAGCEIEKSRVFSSKTAAVEDVRYSLIFVIDLRQELLDQIEFRLDLDSRGKVITSPELPNESCFQNVEFASRATVFGVAQKELGRWDDLRPIFSSKHKLLVWRFTSYRNSWFRGEVHDVALVDACSGKMVETYSYRAIK
jgi:hypothetical protein